MLKKQFLETSRGRIAGLLRRSGLTAEEMASQLRLTTNAVRAELAGMERAGLIRGVLCPLAAITEKHPSACLVIESLVHELVDAPVHECCDRTGRPRCCFEIGITGHA